MTEGLGCVSAGLDFAGPQPRVPGRPTGWPWHSHLGPTDAGKLGWGVAGEASRWSGNAAGRLLLLGPAVNAGCSPEPWLSCGHVRVTLRTPKAGHGQ